MVKLNLKNKRDKVGIVSTLLLLIIAIFGKTVHLLNGFFISGENIVSCKEITFSEIMNAPCIQAASTIGTGIILIIFLSWLFYGLLKEFKIIEDTKRVIH